jgi:hypothetical protein
VILLYLIHVTLDGTLLNIIINTSITVKMSHIKWRVKYGYMKKSPAPPTGFPLQFLNPAMHNMVLPVTGKNVIPVLK